jgi:hypothetical protein
VPTGLAIYPALWLNAFLAGVTRELLGLSWKEVGAVQVAGVFVVFAVAAFLNGALASYAWRASSAAAAAASGSRVVGAGQPGELGAAE